MKLHLPQGLFAALRACVTSPRSLAVTMLSTTMLAGSMLFTLISPQADARIFTWTRGNNTGDAHISGNWSSSDGVAMTWNGAGDVGIEGSVAGREGRNILRFDNDALTKDINVSFSTLSLGGLVVEADVYGYVLRSNGNNSRPLIWRASYDADATAIEGQAGKTNFIIEGGASIGSADYRWTEWRYEADSNFEIGLDGELIVYAQSFVAVGETQYNHTLSGGGFLELNLTDYNLSRQASWSVSDGSIFDLTAATSDVTFGALTMTGGSQLRLGTTAVTLTSNMIVGDGGARVSGSNVNLTGTITYNNTDGSVLSLSGSFVAVGLTLDLGKGEDLELGTHTLFTRTSDAGSLDFEDLDIVGVNSRNFGGITWVDNDLILTIVEFTGSALVWGGGDGTWSNDAASLAWSDAGTGSSFSDGDEVTFGGVEGETGGTISIAADVAPTSVIVTGDADWTFESTGGFMTGLTSLTKDGEGTLTLSLAGDYSGGTSLNAGTLVLNASYALGTGSITMTAGSLVIQHATGLGASDINYSGGTIVYGAGVNNLDLSDDITVLDGANPVHVDFNGNNITWATAFNEDLILSNSAYDPTDAGTAITLTYNAAFAGQSIQVDEGVTLSVTNSNTTAASAVVLSGAGTVLFNAQPAANALSYVGALDDFSGKIISDNVLSIVTFSDANTADSRFDLQSGETLSTTNQNILLLFSTNGADGDTLFIRNLSGNGNIATTANNAPLNRGLNVEMTEDNIFNGHIFGSGGADGRMGTWSVGSVADQSLEFSWTGMSSAQGTYASTGVNAKLQVRERTTFVLSTNAAGDGGGRWADEIELLDTATLEVARTDGDGFVQLATGNEISGAGAVSITGTATLAAANSYTGGTSITGTLTTTHASALGSGDINVLAAGALNISGTLTSTAVLTNEGSTTINGSVQLSESIVNTGNLVLGEDAIIDLSTLTSVTTVGDVTTYAFATGAGTIDFSDFADVDGIFSRSKITGVTSVGKTWKVNADGSITATISGTLHQYDIGGTLDLNNNSLIKGVAFVAGDSIVVSAANAAINVTESVSVASMTVDGVTLSLGGVSGSLADSFVVLENAASVVLLSDVLADSSAIEGAAGTSVYVNLAAGQQLSGSVLEDFDGALSISSGTLSTSDLSFESITVLDQGVLSLTAGTDIGNLIRVESGGTLALEAGEGGDFNGAIYFGDNTTIDVEGNASAIWSAAGILSGEGVLRKTGSGTLSTDKVVRHTGTLDIVEGTYAFGLVVANGSDLGFTEVILRDAGTFTFTHSSSAAMDRAHFHFDGGTYISQDGDAGVNYIGSFHVSQDSEFNSESSANYEVGTVTGSANLTFGGGLAEELNMHFTQLLDYDGNIELAANANLDFSLENISNQAGQTSRVTGNTVFGDDITKTGAGALELGNGMDITGKLAVREGDLTITGVADVFSFEKLGVGTATIDELSLKQNGVLGMNYEGSLTLTSITLDTALTLSYSGANELIHLSQDQLDGVTQIKLLLSELDDDTLRTGIDLGIAATFDETLISVIGIDGDYTLTDVDGRLFFSTNAMIEIPWDENWGSDVIAQAPVNVPVRTELGNVGTSLFSTDADAPYVVAPGVTAIQVTGGGGAAAYITGGLFNNEAASGGAEVTADSWIHVSGGEWSVIVGGNWANNWNGGTTMNFIGDSHIHMDGGTVDHIIGANFGDGRGPSFTGDVYITVAGGTLRGAIVGGSIGRHNATSTLNGDTNIFVYVPLDNIAATSMAGLAGSDYEGIVGGSLRAANTAGGAVHNGNTNVTIDLSGYEGDATNMDRYIIGAGWTSSTNYSSTINGNSTVNITGHENVTFTDEVVAGHRSMGSGTNNITGNTYLNITGGSDFSSWIMGSGATTGGTSNIGGSTYVDIAVTDASAFAQRVTAASNHQGGNATIAGSANLSVDGGNYNQIVMGGFNQHAGTVSIGAGVNVDISNAHFTDVSNEFSIAGAGLIGAGTSTISGGVKVSIDGISYGAESDDRSIVGGHVSINSGTTTINGGVNMSINGGDLASIVLGGIYMSAGGTSSVNGGVNIGVNGGNIDSAIFTAGALVGAGTLNAHITGESKLMLTGGTYASSVFAGYLINNTGSVTASMEDATVVIDGADTGDIDVFGGHLISETGTALNLSSGDMKVVLESGSASTLFGGSSVAAADVAASQQHTSVVLNGGSVTDAVYAAGALQTATGTLTTASSSVSISENVSFAEGVEVSGGYLLTPDAAGNSSSITGESTLIFTGSNDDNLANVHFTQFSQVDVEDANAFVSLGSTNLQDLGADVEKLGAGTLQLAAGNTAGNIRVSEGRLALAAASAGDSISSIRLGSGASLSMTALNTGIGGDLSLVQGSILEYSYLTDGAALGGALSIEANSKAVLDIGFTGTKPSFIEQVLFTDVDVNQLTGFTLTEVVTGMQGFEAGDYFTSIGDITDLSGYYVIVEGDQLVLTNGLFSELTWKGGDGTWSTENSWTNVNGVDSTFMAEFSALFNQGTGTVSVTNEIATRVEFAAVGTDYIIIGNSLTVNELLDVNSGASVTFNNTTLDLSKALVKVDATSSLTIGNEVTINSLQNSGEITVNSNMTVNSGNTDASVAGNLSVTGNLTLNGTDGQIHAFAKLTVDNDVTSTLDLSLGNESKIDGVLTLTGDLTTSGDVAIDSVAAASEISSLSNDTGTLTVGSAMSLANLDNAGSISMVGYTLTLTEATTNGGNINASSITLKSNTDNSFGLVDVGSMDNSGTLSIAAGSEIQTNLTGGSLSITTGDDTATTSIGSITNGLNDLTLSMGQLNVLSGFTISGELNNSSSLDVDGILTFAATSTVIAGGDVSATDVQLNVSGNFNSLDVTGTVTNLGTLGLAADSDIGVLTGGSLAISAGDVTIGEISQELQSLSNGAGELEVSSDVSVVDFSNTGTVRLLDKDLTLNDAEITDGGIVSVKNLTVGVDAGSSASFESITATAAVTAKGALSISADSSAADLEVTSALHIDGDVVNFTVSGNNAVNVGSLTGTGSLVVNGTGAVSLMGASSGNNLSMAGSRLTLGGQLSLTGTLSLSNTVASSISADYTLNASQSMIVADSLTSQGINFVIDVNRLVALGLSSGEAYALTELNTGLAADTTVLINGMAIDDTDDNTSFEISINDTGQVVLTATISGNTWIGMDDWDGSTDDWSQGVTSGAPSATVSALFDGRGALDVNLSSMQTASSVLIDAAGSQYSFTGSQLTAGLLAVNNGALVIENNVQLVTGLGEGKDSTGALNVGGQGSLELAGNAVVQAQVGTVQANSTFMIGENASLNVQGSLSIAASANATNEGNLSVGDGSDIETLLGSGTLTILDDASARVGSVDQGMLEVNTGATLTVTTSLTLSEGMVNLGHVNASGASLTLEKSSTQGGSVAASTLSLAGQGNVFKAVEVENLVLTSKLTAGADNMLDVDSIMSGTANDVVLSLTQFESSIADGVYHILGTNAGSSTTLSWADIELDANAQAAVDTLIKDLGKDVALSYGTTGDLSITVEDSTTRTWFVSNNFAATPGLEESSLSAIKPIFNDVAGVKLLDNYSVLDTVDRVYIDEDFTLDFGDVGAPAATDTDGLIIRNLAGSTDTTLTLQGDDTATSVATLENDSVTSAHALVVNDMVLNSLGTHGSELQLNELTFNNSEFNAGLGSSLDVGTLSLTGSSITVGGSAFTRALVDTQIVADNASIDGTSSVTVSATGLYKVTGEVTLETGGFIVAEMDGRSEIGKATLATGSYIESEQGGSIIIDEVELSGDSFLQAQEGGELIVKNISGSASSVLKGDIIVQGGSFTGTYESSAGGGFSTVTVRAGEAMELLVADNLRVQGEAAAVIKLTQDATRSSLHSLSTVGSIVSIGDIATPITLISSSDMNGGSLHFTLNAEDLAAKMASGTDASAALSVMNGAQNLSLSGTHILIGQTDESITSLDLGDSSHSTGRVIADFDLNAASSDVTVMMQGFAFSKYFTNGRVADGKILVDLNNDAYGSLGVTSNGKAGTTLLGGALIALNPQVEGATGSHPSLAGVLDDMDRYLQLGDTAAADALAAAVAGSSVTSLGSSMLASVDRQLHNIHNRAMSMGGNPPTLGSESCYNAWIAAEGSYNKLDADGTSAGHSYSSFGGSFGVDAEVSDMFSIGLAATALYGTVDSSSTDIATGDLNTYSLSAYARITSKSWNHSFVATASMADAQLDRTVNYSTGSYETQGSTDGYGLGLMYELGYTQQLSEDGSSTWQPIFNVALVHASINGYEEDGSDAGLSVGDQSNTYLTFGLGGRLETEIGESTFNRNSVLSMRALLKFDAGDRHTSADVAFLDNARIMSEVEGAEVGAFGIELGAGLSIPVGAESGSLFMDAGCEFREGQSAVNASVGYKTSF